MKEKLSQEQRKTLLENGREVYRVYSLLDMATNSYYSQNSSFLIDGKKQTFKDYLSALILQHPSESNIQASVTLGEHACDIQLVQGEQGVWKVIFSSKTDVSDLTNVSSEIKKIHEYTSKDFIAFCQKYPLTLYQDEKKGFSLGASAKINKKKITLGGKNKISLYQIHLVNFEKMLAHVKSDTPNLNMLVDMATGSGKSFTQALWFLVLYLAGVSGTFAVPRKDLVKQLAKDFQRLLPEEITDMIVVDVGDKNNLDGGISSTSSFSLWTITTHQNLLKNKWDIEAHENSWLCFDEEHEASAVELFKKRIAELGKHSPLLFLSATPSENAYASCENQGAMINFSRRQKIESKVVQPITAHTVAPKDIIKHAMETSGANPIFTSLYTLANGETPSSAAHAYVDVCNTTAIFCEKGNAFYKAPKPEDNARERLRTLRWNIRCPLGEKALVHVCKPDVLINFFNLTQGAGSWEYSVHKEGQTVDRYHTMANSIFDTQMTDIRYSEKYTKAQLAFREAIFFNYLNEIYPEDKKENYNYHGRNSFYDDRRIANGDILNQIDFGSHREYLERRVLHGMIETTLTYLTGYDSAQLDYKRFNDLPALVNEVKKYVENEKTTPDDLCSTKHIKKIKQYLVGEKIPESIAKEIAPLMAEVIVDIDYAFPEPSKMHGDPISNIWAGDIIDNWALDKRLHEKFLDKKSWRKAGLLKFAEKHSSFFLVNGLEKTAHAIQSNRPFYRLHQKYYDRNSQEVKDSPALQELAANDLEGVFDSSASVKVFVPDYLSDDYSPEVVDILFKKGLIGAYVTSERVSGFNDPDLDHVAVLIEKNEDTLNHPAQTTQGIGRMRALNPAGSPCAFLSADRNVTPSLRAELLDHENFYPIFFQAKDDYQKKLLDAVGKNIAKKMEAWINAAVQPNGEIDLNALEKECKEIIFEQFEILYNQFNHDFDKTKQAFLFILEDTYKTLYQNSKILQNFCSRTLDDPLIKIYVFAYNLIGGLWYKLRTAVSYFSFVATSWTDLYFFASHYKEKNKNVSIAKASLAAWIEGKKKGGLKINSSNIYSAWFSPRMFNGNRFADPFPNEKRFIKEVIFGDGVGSKLGEIDLSVHHGDLDPEKLIQYWTEALEAHCKKENIPEAEKNTAKKQIESWVQQNTTINFSKELSEWQESCSENRKKTMSDFLKEEVFGNADVSCYFSDDFKGTGNVDFLHFYLGGMIEAQNPTSFEKEKTYSYIVRNYHYGNLITSMMKLQGLMAPVFNEMEKARDNDEGMSKEVVKAISRYFEMPLFAEEVGAIIDNLPNEHLLTLLDALYPYDASTAKKDPTTKSIKNEEKLVRLRKLSDDCDRLSAKAFVRTYLNESMDTRPNDNCLSWFFDVFTEVKQCLCYYHRINDQGKSSTSSPALKRNREHKIWHIDPYEGIQSNTFMSRYMEIWSAGSMLNAMPALDEVHAVKSTYTISAMKDVADNFIKPLCSYFSGNFFAQAARYIKSHQNLTPRERTVFSLASELGEKFAGAQPLTQADVLSPTTEYVNAVEKLRAS